MKNKLLLGSTVLLLALLSSCSSESDNSSDTFIVNRTSYFEGKKLYTTHCSSCHQENGQGYASLYPPLANSDYLLADPERSVRIIKLGLDEKILVNAKAYKFKMPANGHLNNEEIAHLVTYITNSWGNQGVNMNTADVKKALLSD